VGKKEKHIYLVSVIIIIGVIVTGGLVDQNTLNLIYRWFGVWFNIAWLGRGENTALVSDVGHGISSFLLCLLLLLRWPAWMWRILLGIIIMIATIEFAQFFIEKRQPSAYDFAYGMIGVISAWIISRIIQSNK